MRRDIVILLALLTFLRNLQICATIVELSLIVRCPDQVGIFLEQRNRSQAFLNLCLNGLNEMEFYSNFRMSRRRFQRLCSLLPFPQGPNQYPIDHCLLVFLWVVGHGGDGVRAASELFGVSEGFVSQIVHKCAKLIVTTLGAAYIVFPTAAERETAMQAFFTKTGFPNVFGCVDGTHILVSPPRADTLHFVNRKGQFSLNCQGCCDHRGYFFHFLAGKPGSYHDARVFRESGLGIFLETNRASFADCWILGDAAYPVSPFLLPPFKDYGNLTPPKNHYNEKQSSTRMAVEKAFGVLKAKWRILKTHLSYSPTRCTRIINACVILHNFLIVEGERENDEGELDVFNEDESGSECESGGDENEVVGEGLGDGDLRHGVCTGA
eukprot:GCRY01004816.1.p1 GENE.GCRY01004816.1~~GCRY01004816.1.p1  ORF type:complete len:380 (+),score=45.21 GCRY01004816.1:52-1191(+)